MCVYVWCVFWGERTQSPVRAQAGKWPAHQCEGGVGSYPASPWDGIPRGLYRAQLDTTTFLVILQSSSLPLMEQLTPVDRF